MPNLVPKVARVPKCLALLGPSSIARERSEPYKSDPHTVRLGTYDFFYK